MINNKALKILAVVVAVIGLAVIFYILTYVNPWRDPLSTALKQLAPALIVAGQTVSVHDLTLQIDLAQNLDPNVSFKSAEEQLVKNLKMAALAKKLGVTPSNAEIDQEVAFYKANKEAEFGSLIKNYFLNDQNLFKQTVIFPSRTEAKLRIYYNSDHNSNAESFDKANSLLTQVLSGKDFSQLAKQESDDKFSGQIGGDLGFFEEGQVIPELQRVIETGEPNQVYDHIVVSRFGYHIVYPLLSGTKDGKKVWHAKHILIKTSGFEEWFKVQANQIRVWKIKS